MRRRSDERGVALPSPVALVSLGAVVVAGVAFVSTMGETEQPEAARQVRADSTPTPPVVAQPPIREKKAEPRRDGKKNEKKEPRKDRIRRGDVYVEVYNNSGITGLAASTAATIAGAGWQVVGTDNWYGTISASTVYFPDRLEKQARVLARNLGITRVAPSISPMRFDRLTVILTTDYA